MNATLEADLCGSVSLGLGHPTGDLIEIKKVGITSEIERQRTLGEGAELALERTDVGVIDIPVDDIGHVIAHGRTT